MTRSPGNVRALFETLVTAITDHATACHLDGSLVSEVGDYVDAGTTHAKSAEQLLVDAYQPTASRLLDYGCGAGGHRDFIEGIGYQWFGVDYIDSVSPLARTAVAEQSDIMLYDGWTLPFDDNMFDVVYSMLVFHHLRHVDRAFQEIGRVLRPGGAVIGQVSAMEQMQDYGTFNFTPLGLKVAAEQAGLEIARIYPKHDVFSFMFRRLFITLGASDDNELTSLLDPDGFVHDELINTGSRLGLPVRDVNLLRLKFCTQFVFELRKQP